MPSKENQLTNKQKKQAYIALATIAGIAITGITLYLYKKKLENQRNFEKKNEQKDDIKECCVDSDILYANPMNGVIYIIM